MNYFAMLKERVIDGTSCWFPVDFVRQNHSGRGMCVEGTCKVRADFSLIKFYGAIVFCLGIYKTKKQKIKLYKTKKNKKRNRNKIWKSPVRYAGLS